MFFIIDKKLTRHTPKDIQTEGPNAVTKTLNKNNIKSTNLLTVTFLIFFREKKL